MITPKQIDTKFKDTYSTEAIKFKISEKNQRHIIHMLRDQIYEDKILAPIREYCCNAFDANIEAGKADTAIDITLPNSIEPVWSVRDYGYGLSPTDITEVFTQYGESTKRQSNEVTGCLGIGSKSFFAYTDQFMIETWNGGFKYIYIAALNEDSDAIVKQVSKQTSTKPTGVRISAPIKSGDTHTFNKKSRRYLETLLLTDSKFNIRNDEEGETPDLVKRYSETYLDGMKWWIMHTTADSPHSLDYHHLNGSARIIMGHVTYKLDPDQLSDLEGISYQVAQTPTLYIRVPLGSVSITASREGLEYSKATIAYLTSILPKVAKSLQGVIADHIITADNYWEACRHYNTAEETLPYHLKKLLDGLVHEGSQQAVKGSISLHLKEADGSNRAMDSSTYELKTLRTGKIQLKKSDRQYLKPSLDTSLFIDDMSEAKGKVGRRVRAWMNDNPASNLVLIRHARNKLASSTIGDFVDQLPDIQTVEPVPINYTQTTSTKGSTPSKAVEGLFLLDTTKVKNVSNLNRDCFEPTTSNPNDTELTIIINGFRYDGYDLKWSGKKTDAICRMSELLVDRYALTHRIVAYRPRDAKHFKHIKSFWDTAIEMVTDELKANPSLAYDIVLRRTGINHDVNNAIDESHEVWDMLPYFTETRCATLRKLHELQIHWNKVQKDSRLAMLDDMLGVLGIIPRSHAKKKVPLAGKLTKNLLKQKPILRYIKEPYYYRWHESEKNNKDKELFGNSLRAVIK